MSDDKTLPVPDLPDGDEVPEEFTPAPPPPYPGTYVAQLPANLDDPAMYEEFDTKVNDKGLADPEGKFTGKRFTAKFDGDHPLVITRAPVGSEDEVGKELHARINTRERPRGRKTQAQVLVADSTYLLRALGEEKGVVKTLDEFREKLGKHAGEQVQFDLEWQTNCNPERDAYWLTEDEQGNEAIVPMTDEGGEPKKGCGERYYMQQWTRGDDGKYTYRLVCQCGAVLRPFPQIRNFKRPSGS